MKLSKIAIVTAALAATAFAGDMKFGVVAGAGMSTYHGDNADDAEFQLAYQVGGKMVMPMGGFDLAPELLLAKRGASISYGPADVTIDYFYIAMPILAQFEVAPNILLKAGPQVSIEVSASYGGDGSGDVDDPSLLDLGLVAGAGYKINEQIGVDARFEYGFMEVGKDAKLSNMGFGLNGSYMF